VIVTLYLFKIGHFFFAPQVKHPRCVDGITSIGKMQSNTTFNTCIANGCLYIACLNSDMFRPLYWPSSGCTLSYYKANYTIYKNIVYCIVCFIIRKCRLHLKCDGTCTETRFSLLTKQTTQFKLAGASVQSTAARRAVNISLQGLYCSCKPVFCSHVTLTGYPLHSRFPFTSPVRHRVPSHFKRSLQPDDGQYRGRNMSLLRQAM
jgi:hypothetical protein